MNVNVAKWISVINHIINRHNYDSHLFPEFGGLLNNRIKWVKPGAKAAVLFGGNE